MICDACRQSTSGRCWAHSASITLPATPLPPVSGEPRTEYAGRWFFHAHGSECEPVCVLERIAKGTWEPAEARATPPSLPIGTTSNGDLDPDLRQQLPGKSARATPPSLDRAIETIAMELNHYDLSDDPGYIRVPVERVRSILRSLTIEGEKP